MISNMISILRCDLLVTLRDTALDYFSMLLRGWGLNLGFLGIPPASCVSLCAKRIHSSPVKHNAAVITSSDLCRGGTIRAEGTHNRTTMRTSSACFPSIVISNFIPVAILLWNWSNLSANKRSTKQSFGWIIKLFIEAMLNLSTFLNDAVKVIETSKQAIIFLHSCHARSEGHGVNGKCFSLRWDSLLKCSK